MERYTLGHNPLAKIFRRSQVFVSFFESDHGEWVRYEDAQAEIYRLREALAGAQANGAQETTTAKAWQQRAEEAEAAIDHLTERICEVVAVLSDTAKEDK